MNLPGRAIEIFVEGGTDGFTFYQDGGPEQASPLFPKTKEGADFQTNTSYYFYAKHPDRAPEPRLIRIYFDGTGKQVTETVEESRPIVGIDDLDDTSLRTDLSVEAVDPDGVMMSVLTSIGYVLRRYTPASFSAWLGFIFPNAQELILLREMLEIPDESAPEYVAPDDAELVDLKERLDIAELAYVAPDGPELAALRDRLDIPELPDPVWVPPSKDEQYDQLLDVLNRRRRGGLGSIPLSDADLLFLAWQLAPIIGFAPIVDKPADYAELVDELTARSIARQVVFGEWGFEFDLLGLSVRIVLEQAEVLVLAGQLAPLFGYDKYVAPTLLEQINELSDEVLEAIRLRINTSAPSFMDQFRATTDTERLEIRDIIPCCEGEGTVPTLILTTVAHWEPVPTGSINRAPTVTDPMPDVAITQLGVQSFALPDTMFTDPDGDKLSILVTQTNGAALPTGLTYNSGTRTFTAQADFNTAVAIRVKAADPGNLSVYDDFLLTFNRTAQSTNHAPILTDRMPDVHIKEQGERTFALPDTMFSDPDGDTLTTNATQVNGSALPAGFSYNPGTRTFTVAADFNTSVAVRVTATDPGNLSASQDFLLTFDRQIAVTTPRITGVDLEFIVSASGNKLRLWTRVEGATNGVTTQFNKGTNTPDRTIGNQPAFDDGGGFTHYREYPATDPADGSSMAGVLYFLLGPIDPVSGSVNVPGNAAFQYTIPPTSISRRAVYILA